MAQPSVLPVGPAPCHRRTIDFQSEEQFSLTGAVGAATKLGFGAAQQLFGVNGNAAVSTIDVTTRAGANEAIDIADVALKQVSGIR